LNSRSHPPKFFDQEGKGVALTIAPGEIVTHQGVWYMGKAWVNLAGTLEKGLSEVMWVINDLEAKEGLRIYFARMKIEESFRNLKSLPGMTKLMNKQQTYMEKMLALLLLVYTIGLMPGEGISDRLYGEIITENEPALEKGRLPGSANLKKGKKWKRYSGLFILLKQKWFIPKADRLAILDEVLAAFIPLVQRPVRTHV